MSGKAWMYAIGAGFLSWIVVYFIYTSFQSIGHNENHHLEELQKIK
jgi:hypothetical protein